jgi:alanine-synthesizing transaminase
VRTGWVYFTGDKKHAADYLEGLELLASLRLCSNVPGQWAVQTALGGVQSIYELTSDEGRLGRQRRALLRGIERSEFLDVVAPRGALYAFPSIDRAKIQDFDDGRFAMELLESEHVLVVPGSSFNVPYVNHLRLTLLPDEETLAEVFVRMERRLAAMAGRSR